MVTRRGFLTALARTAAVGIAAAKVPLSWITPRSTPTVCGINQATFTFWRNQSVGGAVSPPLNAAMLREIYDSCTSDGYIAGGGLQLLVDAEERRCS